MSKIIIKKIGSFFKKDKDDFLKNPASEKNIKGLWAEAVKDCVEEYKNIYGDKLVSVYIRGSVSKGEAFENISDLDTLAFVDEKQEDIDNSWTQKVEKKLKKKFPFIESFELGGDSTDSLKEKNTKILLIQACCVWGKKFTEPRLKVGKRTILHGNSILKYLGWFDKYYGKIKLTRIKKGRCVWLCKAILRIGFELTMTREKKYTRDLYLCYETFSKYYPEYERKMYKVLNPSLNPSTSEKEIREKIFEISKFIEKEGKKYF